MQILFGKATHETYCISHRSETSNAFMTKPHEMASRDSGYWYLNYKVWFILSCEENFILTEVVKVLAVLSVI